MPASPTAAALERYALMPVNEAAGTPNISIPLYEVKCGSLSLPISVSYHASGIRVADQASWVGLGWALNAGGVITRQVRGAVDERPNGFSYTYNKVPNSRQISSKNNATLLEEVSKSRLDYQPDLYNYNFQGQAGSFLRDTSGTLQCLPLQPVRIEQVDTAFLLTDAHGVTYWFAHQERSRSSGRPPATNRYVSAWHLSRIVSADKADTIRLEYTPYTMHTTFLQQEHTLITQIAHSDGPETAPPRGLNDTYSETQATTTQDTWRLRQLTFRGGRVRFTADSIPRRDIREDRRLVALTVLGQGQDTLKQVRFYHSYYGDQLRLRLDSLATTAPRLALPPYRFTYNSQPLPEQLSGSRDHWGYYNGATPVSSFKTPVTTSLLIPAMVVSRNSGPYHYPGANRTPNPAFVQAGILTAITYPTGGRQSFVYEPNTVPELYTLPPIVSPSSSLTLATAGPGQPDQIKYPAGRHEDVIDTLLVQQTGTMLHYTMHGVRYDPTDTDNIHDVVLLQVFTLAAPASLQAEKLLYFSNPDDPYASEFTDSLGLSPGRYKVLLRSSGNTRAQATLTLASIPVGGVQTAWRNALSGGVRVRELHLQASSRAPVTIRRYYYNTPGTSLSSGYAIGTSVPVYDRPHTDRLLGEAADPPPTFGLALPAYDVNYITLSSSSLGELMGGDRSVGYRYVTVVDSSSTGQTNGYVTSQYVGTPDEGGGWKPALPPTNYSWQRDQLREQWTYATQTGRTPQLLTRTQHFYTVRDSLAFKSFAAGPDSFIQTESKEGKAAGDGLYPYAFANGYQSSGWLYLRQTRQYQYAPADTSSYHLTTTTYHYGNPVHQQPTLVETDLSGGQHQQVRSRYVADYTTTSVANQSSGAAQALRELQRLHAPAQLVEQTTTRTTPTDTLVTHSQLTLSRVLAPGVVVPARQLGLRAAMPPRWRQFQTSRLSGQTLSWDARYETQVTFDHYDAQRQLTQAHLPGGTPLSYLWDAQAGQPLAKVINAAVSQVAATSFEPGAMGGWTYDTQLGIGQHLVSGQGHTGRWAYRLENGWQPSRDSLPAGTYDLSFWYQNVVGATQPRVLVGTTPVAGTALVRTPGNWQQVQVRLSLTAASLVRVALPAGSGDVLIDDLVVRPVGTQLSTYTYDVLRGMSSQTGPDGRTLYYEYDGLGRLVRTRDEQGRILGQQQYHYAGQ